MLIDKLLTSLGFKRGRLRGMTCAPDQLAGDPYWRRFDEVLWTHPLRDGPDPEPLVWALTEIAMDAIPEDAHEDAP